MNKNLFKSKTFWTNFLFGFLGLLSSTGVVDNQVTQTLTSPEVIALANMGLRLITKEPVSIGGGK